MCNKKIIVTTLRRSGSTIFWRCFRRGANALAFDEPFNPNLSQLPRRHYKGIYGEYIDILNKNSSSFWSYFSPIYTIEELDESLRKKQEMWIRWLFSRKEEVVADTTRCWRKIEHLKDILEGEVFLIHLHRSPTGFVASHLLPSEMESSVKGQWKLFKRRRRFFEMDTGFDYWNMEELTGYGPTSAYSTKLLDGSPSPETFYSWNAHARLLHFWKTAFQHVERTGKEQFGERFFSVAYERFCQEPEQILQEIEEWTGLSIHLEKIPTVRTASSVFRHGDERWYRAAEKVGLEATPEVLFRSEYV